MALRKLSHRDGVTSRVTRLVQSVHPPSPPQGVPPRVQRSAWDRDLPLQLTDMRRHPSISGMEWRRFVPRFDVRPARASAIALRQAGVPACSSRAVRGSNYHDGEHRGAAAVSHDVGTSSWRAGGA